jgi:hypothetical protein
MTECSDSGDLDFDDVPGLEVPFRVAEAADARGVPVAMMSPGSRGVKPET